LGEKLVSGGVVFISSYGLHICMLYGGGVTGTSLTTKTLAPPKMG